MRIVIITPAAPAHHLHLCAYLASRHDVVAVIHPSASRSSIGARLRRLRKQAATSGWTLTALRALASVPNPLVGWDAERALADGERLMFPDAAAAYEQAGVAAIAHHVEDVNAPEAIALVRDSAADAVVCLGGPIYREPLIAACPTMINFHSGISPLYNGASTIMFAFANGHIRLCGGTLMTMSPAVDGGDILAHYLPAIEPDDNPATLFLRTVRGAATIIDEFLGHFDRTGAFTSAPQGSPALFYTRSDGWTIQETQKVRRLLKERAAERYVRDEQLVRYWDLGSDDEALRQSRRMLEGLIGLR